MDILPEELVLEIAIAIADDPVSASRCGAVSKALRRSLAEVLNERMAAASWELVELHSAVAKLTEGESGNCCGFVYACIELDTEDGSDSGIADTRARIRGFAQLLERHPRASLHVDAHCGAGAPGSIAHSYSHRRALLVADEAVKAARISRSRITCSGHGKYVVTPPHAPPTSHYWPMPRFARRWQGCKRACTSVGPSERGVCQEGLRVG